MHFVSQGQCTVFLTCLAFGLLLGAVKTLLRLPKSLLVFPKIFRGKRKRLLPPQPHSLQVEQPSKKTPSSLPPKQTLPAQPSILWQAVADFFFFIAALPAFLGLSFFCRFPTFRPYMAVGVFGGFLVMRKILHNLVAKPLTKWYNLIKNKCYAPRKG